MGKTQRTDNPTNIGSISDAVRDAKKRWQRARPGQHAPFTVSVLHRQGRFALRFVPHYPLEKTFDIPLERGTEVTDASTLVFALFEAYRMPTASELPSGVNVDSENVDGGIQTG